MSVRFLTASLRHDEAVLRFPYDEDLRLLLRAIPGRRWDPVERTWCVPLGDEQAEALALLLDGLPCEPDIEEQLARVISRRRSRRRRQELLLDVVRPDSEWWLSFATDAAPEPVAALLAHPEARELERIGRAQVPLDDRALQIVASLRSGPHKGAVHLSAPAERALSEREQPAGAARRPRRP